MNQDNLPLDCDTTRPLEKGEGVDVYILDTGIQLDHREYQGRAYSLWDFVNNKQSAWDDQGHGTHIAAIIGGNKLGVAPKVRMYSVKV
jgi:subtilisin family serine protease